MTIESISYEGQVITVCCSGEFGIGSQGQPSADLLFNRLAGWMNDHPDKPVNRIDVDFREVDYTWGDGPISALIPIISQQGVTRIRIVASDRNVKSLHDLVEKSKLPWFIVVDADT